MVNKGQVLPARPLTARSKNTREAKRREVRLKNILDDFRLLDLILSFIIAQIDNILESIFNEIQF